MDILHSLSSVSACVASALVASIWQGLVLAGAVALCLRLLPGISAAARSVIWMAVFLLVGVLDVMALPGGRVSLAGPMTGTALRVDMRWSLAVVVVWAALSVLRGAQLVVEAFRLRGMAQRATPLASPGPVDVSHGSVNLRGAQLCSSDEVRRPCVVGFFAPRILLPAGLCERLSAGELEQVVLHEVEHLRRSDDWTNLLQKIGLVLVPLNPVLFWVERRLCMERELACDDYVLRCTKARKSYAACLANLAEHSVARRQVSLALGALERRSELAQRVYRILRKPEAAMGRGRSMAVVGLVMFGLVAGAGELARSPQLVRFTPSTSEVATVATVAPRRDAPAAARMQDVVFRPAAAWATATTRRPNAVSARAVSKAVVSPARSRTGRRRPSWVVLTRWDGASAPSLMTFAVAGDSTSSYAAVPTASGWLVFQL